MDLLTSDFAVNDETTRTLRLDSLEILVDAGRAEDVSAEMQSLCVDEIVQTNRTARLLVVVRHR